MGVGPAPGHALGPSSGRRRKENLPSTGALSDRDTGMNTPTTNRSRDTQELELSPMSRKVKHFDKYSRKGGRWSWKRPSYERDVVSLVKTERRIEEGIASALTEVEAVEAGLRYFDELIMPENKKKISPFTAAQAAVSSTNPRSHATSSEGGVDPIRTGGRKAIRTRPGLRSQGCWEGGRAGKERGGFSKSQEEKVRDYAAARKSGVGRGSTVTSSSDRAVAECVDLKLTLKQRLDNYDRQRGINIEAFRSDSPTTAPSVPIIDGNIKAHDGVRHTNSNNNTGGSRTPTAIGASRKGHEVGALAPCCDGGVPDPGGGVGQILSRSLGKAAASVRRNKPTDNDCGTTNGGQQKDGSAARSRWQSWNGAPPAALLGAEGRRKLSAAQDEGGKRGQETPASGVVIKDEPAFNGRRRARGVGGSSSSSSASDEKGGVAGETSAAASASSARRVSEEKHSGGGTGEGVLSASTSSSSSRRMSSGGSCGVPLVPRVAMLAAACATEKNDGEAVRKGKEFDPDQLECVRRHEASVAERERRVRHMRTEAEKKTVFRARPLPAFLDSGDGATDSGQGFLSSRDGSAAARKGEEGARGQPASARSCVAASSPELLEALEQDEEARALVEKIGRINPRVDIAALVSQPTPWTPLPLPPATRTSESGCGVQRRPSSRGALHASPSAVVASAPSNRLMSTDAPPSLSKSTTASGHRKTCDLEEQSLSSSIPTSRATCLVAMLGGDGEPRTTKTVEAAAAAAMTRTLEKEVAHVGGGVAPQSAADDKALGYPPNHSPQAGVEEEGRLPPVEAGSGGQWNQPKGEVSRQENQCESTAAAVQEGEVGREGEDGGSEEDPGRSRRRSLMGRMLESGMLERQKEWAKARRRKVLEWRKQVEEAKEQEGKGDILDIGLSSRSWSKAKTQHLRSLERQRLEEEEREAIREARRRASAFRAEREREAAERRAAEIALNLAAAEDAVGTASGIRSGRGGGTAPNSRGGEGKPRSRRPPPPPRRARSHADNNGTPGSAEDGGSFEPVATGQRRRRTDEERSRGRGEEEGDDPALAADADVNLSEDSFYRVAVETIMEKEKLGVDEVGGNGGSGSGGENGGDEGRRSRGQGRRHGRARNGAATDPLMFASHRSVAAGRRARRKSGMAPRNRRKDGDANAGRLPQAATAGSRTPSETCPTRRQSYHASVAPDTNSFGSYPAAPSGSSPTGKVARTSSLLSLYEAQSVEYPNVSVGGVHRDNSGPYLGDKYPHAPLDVERSVYESGAQGFVETEWPDYGVQQRAKFVGGDDQTAGKLAEALGSVSTGAAKGTRTGTHLPPTRTKHVDYPWSDERRAPWSSGSGGGARRGVAGDRHIDVGGGTVGKEPRPGRSLGIGDASAYQGEKDASEEIARWQGPTTGPGASASEGGDAEATTPGGYSHQRSPSGAVRPQPSPRKRCSLERCRTQQLGSSATASSQAAASQADGKSTTMNQSTGAHRLQATQVPTPPHCLKDNSRDLYCDLRDGGVGGGGRFSLWSSSDEEASITEIECYDEGGDERHAGSERQFQVREGASALHDGDRHPSRSDDGSGRFEAPEIQALLSAAASAGGFFDAATSSADKGRFKVRDPRLFDPCSMRRRPDAVTEPAQSTVLTGGGNNATSSATHARGQSSSGVTFLLGCRAAQCDADDTQTQERFNGGEQVITVMFDRSKFNEEEAKRWWLANRARIEGIGEQYPGR